MRQLLISFGWLDAVKKDIAAVTNTTNADEGMLLKAPPRPTNAHAGMLLKVPPPPSRGLFLKANNGETSRAKDRAQPKLDKTKQNKEARNEESQLNHKPC